MYLAFRSARPFLLSSKHYCRQHRIRQFSATRLRQATEATPNTDGLYAAMKESGLLERLSKNPDAILAVQELGKIIHNSGIELAPGQAPTTTQMLKLSMNSDFRQAVTRAAEEMKKAGIDLHEMAKIMGFNAGKLK